MAEHSDGNGRTFISLSTWQFIITLVVLVLSIMGGVWQVHTQAVESINMQIAEKIGDLEIRSRGLVESHNRDVEAHGALFDNAKVIQSKDIEELRKAIVELKSIVEKLEGKIR